MTPTFFVLLICLAVSNTQLATPKKCSDRTSSGLTMEALCGRVQNRKCIEDPQTKIAYCTCEPEYKNELGACIPKKCNERIDNSAVTWNDWCRVWNMTCKDGGHSLPQCTCKTGYTRNDFGICIAQTCDEFIKDWSITWRQACEVASMKCLDSEYDKPICVASLCKDIKLGTTTTWNEICEVQKMNLVCKESEHTTPRCDCKVGFTEDAGKCRAMTCSDSYREPYGATGDEICALISAPQGECFSAPGQLPACVCSNKFKNVTVGQEKRCEPKSCNEVRTGMTTWKSFCANTPFKECRENVFLGPDCVCIDGYIEQNGVCIAQTCDQKPENSAKTYRENCQEAENQVCVQTGNNKPRCECKTGFHKIENTEHCIPSSCSDNVPGQTVSYEFNCKRQKCVVSLNLGPICVLKACNDTYNTATTYEALCKSKPNMYCEEIQNGVPLCQCKKGYKKPPGGGPYECQTQDCSDVHESGLTWVAFCAKDSTRTCIKENGKLPECQCKPGFSDVNLPHCKQIFCPNLTLPEHATPGEYCNNVKAGGSCKVSCEHGFDPQPAEHICGPRGMWDNNVATCKQIIGDKLCPELFAPANGTVTGTCKSARPASWCIFNCNPGFQFKKAGFVDNRLMCTQSGNWAIHEPSCVDKCQVEDNILMCKQDNAKCFNDYKSEDIKCVCNSPYLTWSRGNGCQYHRYGYHVTVEGLMYVNQTEFKKDSYRKLMADTGSSTSEVEPVPTALELGVLLSEILRVFTDFLDANVYSSVQDRNTNTWKTESIVFFQRPQMVEILEFTLRNFCPELNKEGFCVFDDELIKPQDLNKTKVKNVEHACKSGLHRCPVGSTCIQDLDNPMVFTCECNRQSFKTVHETFQEDRNTFRTVVCEHKSSGTQVTVTKVNDSVVVVGAVLGFLLFISLCAVAILTFKLKKK